MQRLPGVSCSFRLAPKFIVGLIIGTCSVDLKIEQRIAWRESMDKANDNPIHYCNVLMWPGPWSFELAFEKLPNTKTNAMCY